MSSAEINQVLANSLSPGMLWPPSMCETHAPRFAAITSRPLLRVLQTILF